LTINGFTIAQLQGGPATGTAPLNVWLTGSNTIAVEVSKQDPRAKASFSLGVSELVMGDVASTGDPGTLINIALTDADLPGPAKKASKTFKSALDFSGHLLANKPSRFDEKAVLDYAAKLHGLFQKKNAAAILEAMSIKAEDYARAYGQPTARMREELSTQLQEETLTSRLVAIDRKQLRAERINHLWHIYDGKSELIRSQSTDGAASELPIYVGDVDGKLVVVR
jgi:hypothetical protein